MSRVRSLAERVRKLSLKNEMLDTPWPPDSGIAKTIYETEEAEGYPLPAERPPEGQLRWALSVLGERAWGREGSLRSRGDHG